MKDAGRALCQLSSYAALGSLSLSLPSADVLGPVSRGIVAAWAGRWVVLFSTD
jgi:hypothetical protein